MIGRLFVMLTGLFAVGSACVASPPLENLLIGNHDSRFDKLAASIMRNTHSHYDRKENCWTMEGNTDECWRPVSLNAPAAGASGKRKPFYYLLAVDVMEGASAKMFVVEHLKTGGIYFHGVKTAKSHGGHISIEDNGFGRNGFVQVGRELYGWKIHEDPPWADANGGDSYYVFPARHTSSVYQSRIRKMGEAFTVYTDYISTKLDEGMPISRVNDYVGRTGLDSSNPEAEIYPLKITYKGILDGVKACGGCEVTGGRKLPEQTCIAHADPKTLQYRIPDSCPMKVSGTGSASRTSAN